MIRSINFTIPCFVCIAASIAIYTAIITVVFHSCSSVPNSTSRVLNLFHPSSPRHHKPSSTNLKSLTRDFDSTGAYSQPVLKVFMYDLPRKFTFGVIEEYQKARSVPIKNASQIQYPGHQHGAEWFLFRDLQKPQGERIGSPSVRVSNPSDADVFFVPVFSSLSLLVNPANSTSKTNYSDERMQMELVEWLEQQDTWHRNNGRDHVILCQDPNALHTVIDRVKNSILLLSDFGRLSEDQGSWWKDVVLPYTHRISSYVRENPKLERNTLLFFMGNRYRKEGGKVRDELFKLLENEKDMIIKHGIQSREGRRIAAQGMRTSKFCLHPAGDTPSACRLFDAIVSICVPVIVSDDIELPFEDELDYTKFSIFVPSNKALEPDYLASMLRGFSNEKLHEYQQELRKVRNFFEYDELNGAVDHIWHAIATKLPRMRTMIHKDRRAVTSLP